VPIYACMNGLDAARDRFVFLVDTHVNYDPSPQELCEITVMAAEEMVRFGTAAQGGTAVAFQLRQQQPAHAPSRCASTLAAAAQQAPWLEVDGEMHGDLALDGAARCAP
jgi:malate dehydrogenase (oxaloacetate-decarboxylating)(NADP+)